ncbi:DEAD/DEAH box helicase [Vibrio sp. SCSIO 43140]|uniref:DEAD/DEAH box helicase n=1 Tax=Vibrio sp. SCSIO 43140 TaxID=2819100 RepID=UPI002075723C|nr:DEAD/DEAH box helicase [Vibrio sp. SCSIO 43140]USD59486.1 DEAD/DEAH box helicase [Vibrio sp. SCSIO 43140]
MELLVECLKEMSEEQLISMLPPGSAEFVDGLIDSETFLRDKIVNAVALSSASRFVTEKVMREELINTLSPKMLKKIFPSYDNPKREIGSEHYKHAIEWTNTPENQLLFAEKLGILDELIAMQSTNTKVRSICRISPKYKMYPYQKKISDKALSQLKTEKRLLIHLPTGAGKTRTAMNIAVEHLRCSPNNLVLWLADREELCQQAFDEFGNAWRLCGVRDTTVYGFYSSSSESLGGIDSGFIVAGLHTLNSIRDKDSRKLQLLYEELRKKVTLVIFDEAHKAIANTYQAVTEDFVESDKFNARLIGLTATPGRTFGCESIESENYKLAKFFHFNKISMAVSGFVSPIDYLVSNGYLAKANFVSLNYLHSKVTGYNLQGEGARSTFQALADNQSRNKVLLETIKKEADSGKQVIVFACSVSHAQHLSTALNCLGITSASIDSKLDTSESRRFKISQYKKGDIQVLTNFNVLTAGFDAPQTSVTVIAKPTNSLVEYLQMAGRAMRGTKSGGNKECWIYNVHDDIPEFQSINLAFEHWDQMWAEVG